MNSQTFRELCISAYNECRDFWETDSPEVMPDNFQIMGAASILSSVEAVTFIAAVEERLATQGIDLTFIDYIIENENLEMTCESMYEILASCAI